MVYSLSNGRRDAGLTLNLLKEGRQMAKRNGATGAADSNKPVSTPRGPRGPVFNWTGARRAALVSAIANGAGSVEDIHSLLGDDPEFAGGEVSLTPKHIQTQLTALRKKGVELPKLGGRSSQVDVEALNSILRQARAA